MPEEKKKYKNLATYATIMVLAVIILIIFAAMADSREQRFENQLDEKESLNVSIQNEIVRLKDENYDLQNNVDNLTRESEEKDGALSFYTALTEAWELYGSGDTDAAAEKLSALDGADLTEEEEAKSQTLKALLESDNN